MELSFTLSSEKGTARMSSLKFEKLESSPLQFSTAWREEPEAHATVGLPGAAGREAAGRAAGPARGRGGGDPPVGGSAADGRLVIGRRFI